MSINRPLACVEEEFDSHLINWNTLLIEDRQRQVEKDPVLSPEKVNKT